ncbi:NlpC/P60 family protein [Aggregatibacter segnis]|uniref:NlpC/P60 family protein n=1 Tax=Aggregatibacter segnis TaxID=739 RepID=UPI000D69918E|nr:NlpC/P60 family protein [Aggregatibacter segnis]
MFKKFLMIVPLFVLAACSNSTKNVAASVQDQEQLNQLIHAQLKTNKPHQYSEVMDKQLANIYQEWAGTRYRLGGLTKGGIDCSGFMQTTFLKAYGLALPRSTSEQRHVGTKIEKSELKVGDLVFFRKNKHVGVYIGGDKFMHSSTSRGVIIESLNDDYWARTYTQSRRVL